MQSTDLKYLGAYIGPLVAYISIGVGGSWSYGAVILSFVLIPLIELILGSNTSNVAQETSTKRALSLFFDVLLYLNAPLLYGLIFFFLWRVSNSSLTPWEIIGMTLSVGTYVGASGINVAHELGHRPGAFEKWLARILLTPGLYTHFMIEHNHGHHRWVGTFKDPATARLGETVYAFWFRSTWGGLLGAIRIEQDLLARNGQKFWSFGNRFIMGVMMQSLYLGIIYVVFGTLALGLAIAIGVMGFLLLESINYIEHYGLLRKRTGGNQYERVSKIHSWNSNHDIGRIFLYELTRHADHHYKASKKYQLLQHIDESPQLPTGYPGSIILALIPPLWFKIMNPRVPSEMVRLHTDYSKAA